MIICVVQEEDDFIWMNYFLILGIFFGLLCDIVRCPELGTSLTLNFVLGFFLLLFSPWVIFQPLWFLNVVGCAASQKLASRLCQSWRDTMVKLSDSI